MSDVQSYPELNPYSITKIAFACAAIICFVVYLPRLHKHRQHPVLKYRTFPLYLMAMGISFQSQIALYLLDAPIEYSVTGYLAFYFFEGILLAA